MLKWQDSPSLKCLQLKEIRDWSQFGLIAMLALLFCLSVGGVAVGASKNWQTGIAAAGLVATLQAFLVSLLAICDNLR
jgi:hypothetical protein